MRSVARVCLFVGVLSGLWPSIAGASFQVKLTFEDAGRTYASYYDQITAGMQAAAADWGSHIISAGVLRVQVNFLPPDGNVIASAKSAYSTRVGTDNGIRVYQMGALTAITKPALIPSGSTFDAVLNIYTNYLGSLWFDPDPTSRLADVPLDKFDAQSVFLHEMGHMLFMSGWRDQTTGELPADYMSTFDQHVIKIGDYFYFDGKRANAEYGGPVPLTTGNMRHVGGNPNGPGYDMIDVMYPGTPRGQRRYITDLDLAMAADTGILLRSFGPPPPPPPVVPEPSSLALLGIGLLVVAPRAHRRIHRRAA